MIAVWTRFRIRTSHNWSERGKVGVMRRAQDSQSVGQIAYELCVSEDRTPRIWQEWREIPLADQARWEDAVRQFAEHLQRQEDDK